MVLILVLVSYFGFELGAIYYYVMYTYANAYIYHP